MAITKPLGLSLTGRRSTVRPYICADQAWTERAPRQGALPDAAAQGAEQGQGGEVGSGHGAGADAEVDRDPALLGPVDVLEVQEQRELIDNERDHGPVGQGEQREPAAGFRAADGDD